MPSEDWWVAKVQQPTVTALTSSFSDPHPASKAFCLFFERRRNKHILHLAILRRSFSDLHWLPVKFRVEFKIHLITFKSLRGLAPTYTDSLISIRPTSRCDLRSSEPLSKATLGARSLTYSAPKLWNALSLAFRSVNTVTDFKGNLKTCLFSKAFLLKSKSYCFPWNFVWIGF